MGISTFYRIKFVGIELFLPNLFVQDIESLAQGIAHAKLYDTVADGGHAFELADTGQTVIVAQV